MDLEDYIMAASGELMSFLRGTALLGHDEGDQFVDIHELSYLHSFWEMKLRRLDWFGSD